MKTLTETCAEVNYNQLLRAVEIKWNGFAEPDQHRRVLEYALQIMRDYRCSIWISDMSNGKSVPREAIEWLKKTFVPKAMQLGIRKMGFLVTGNAFAKLHAANLKTATKQHGIEMEYFESRAALEDWIFS